MRYKSHQIREDGYVTIQFFEPAKRVSFGPAATGVQSLMAPYEYSRLPKEVVREIEEAWSESCVEAYKLEAEKHSNVPSYDQVINAQVKYRILQEGWTIARQLNVLRDGTDEDVENMRSAINRIRDRGRELRQSPVEDPGLDKHWS